MHEYIEIIGGTKLYGEVQVSGAKNAVLPMLIASLLTSEEVIYRNVPELSDVSQTLRLLEQFGAKTFHTKGFVKSKTKALKATEASYSLVKSMRASFWILGPLLARGGAARVALPGGDIIGARPVDLHLSALKQMGAEITVKNGVVLAHAKDGLKPADIKLRFPSVGATHQVLLAASLTPGETILRGAAREPEVVALANMLSSMGADVTGAGTDEVRIIGKEYLKGTEVSLIGDRIEAATYVLASAVTGGKVKVKGFNPNHFGKFLDILKDMGVKFECSNDSITVEQTERIKGVNVTTAPFPGLATDIQPVLMAALSVADGESEIEESIFEGRFAHVTELCRMGAQIEVIERKAKICGVDQLSSAPVEGNDIRAAAAMVVAALTCRERTQVFEPQHIKRGYSSMQEKLINLGVSIGIRQKDAEDFLLIGC